MTEQEAEASIYAKVINMPRRTVLAFFKERGITSLRDVHQHFPRPGFVHQDMREAIESWVFLAEARVPRKRRK